MDTAYKFWKKFVAGDALDRQNQLKLIVDRFMAIEGIENKKIKQHTYTIALLSYFEDLVEYMQNKEEQDDGLGEEFG